MKKYLFTLLTVISLMIACSKEDVNQEMHIREIAWNSLTAAEKQTVKIKWEDAVISESSFQNKASYAVRFNTTDEMLLGPITVYLSKDKLGVLGQALRH